MGKDDEVCKAHSGIEATLKSIDEKIDMTMKRLTTWDGRIWAFMVAFLLMFAGWIYSSNREQKAVIKQMVAPITSAQEK